MSISHEQSMAMDEWITPNREPSVFEGMCQRGLSAANCTVNFYYAVLRAYAAIKNRMLASLCAVDTATGTGFHSINLAKNSVDVSGVDKIEAEQLYKAGATPAKKHASKTSYRELDSFVCQFERRFIQ